MKVTFFDKSSLVPKIYSTLFKLPAKYFLYYLLRPIDTTRYMEFSYFLKFLRENNFDKNLKILDVSSPHMMAYYLAKNNFVLKTNIDESEKKYIKESKRLKFEIVDGTKMPFEDNSFNVVLCCDVLEHVQDLPKVISEISRVLKIGGIFISDTFNRTYFSKISAIKILQEWKRWSIMPPKLHVWQMFIKPHEIKSLLHENHLDWKEHRGMELNVSILNFLCCLRKRARGELTYKDLGEKLSLVESGNMNIIYMGYAIKK